jgi:hypothetical protein
MSANSHLIPAERIERRILLVRGQKVLLDFQLAGLYEVPIKALNQAVKRNQERFPEGFMFRLSEAEMVEVALTPGITAPWPVRLISCGAAADSSPRREPWVGGILDKAPAGAADSESASIAPAGACPLRDQTHGSRRGLHSFAPPALETERQFESGPFAYTEHGIALLSGLLRGRPVAKATVSILRAFAQMTKQEQLEADAESAMNVIRAWLERDRSSGVETPRSPWLLPTAPRRDCAPRFQSHFATRKSKLP